MTSLTRKAVFVDLPNFYSRLLDCGLGTPRELRDYFLEWLDLDLLAKWLTGEPCPVWVFYSGRRIGPSAERIEDKYLEEYIKRITRLPGVTAYDVNIPGKQREAFIVTCDKCGTTAPGQWESEKGVDASLIVHLFDTADSWDEAVLLSGDADFTPAVRALRRRGKLISGAGFSSAAECLVREFYSFEDLANGVLRHDFAAYLLFGKGRLISKWMTDAVTAEEVKSNLAKVTFSCSWSSGNDSAPVYSDGQVLLIQQYDHVSLGSDGLVPQNSRLTLLAAFATRFPELATHSPMICVSPEARERVDRTLPTILREFSGNASGETGIIASCFVKNNEGEYKRQAS